MSVKANTFMITGIKLGRWDDFFLRSIGVFKLFKSGLALACSIYIFHLIRNRVPDILSNLIQTFHIRLEGEIAQWILDNCAELINGHIHTIGIIILVYAFIFVAEGIGLILRKTWAEYLAIVSTTIPLPFEVFTVVRQPALWDFTLMLFNIGMIVFLIHRLYTVHQLEKKRRENQRDKESLVKRGAVFH